MEISSRRGASEFKFKVYRPSSSLPRNDINGKTRTFFSDALNNANKAKLKLISYVNNSQEQPDNL
jgi:hypothetical protein